MAQQQRWSAEELADKTKRVERTLRRGRRPDPGDELNLKTQKTKALILMMQRLVALILLAGLGFVAARHPVAAAETSPTNHFRITTGPLLQMPMETSLTVMWMTDRDSTGVVEYGPPGGN